MDLMLDSLVTENMCKMSFRTFIQFVMVKNRIITLEKIVEKEVFVEKIKEVIVEKPVI